MRLIFCKSNTLSSWFIRLLTFSEWSHVGIEIHGTVVDATARHGVAVTPLKTWLAKYGTTFSVDIDLPERYKAEFFLTMQIGQKYDFMALIALPFRRDWQRDKRWFCSELAAAFLIAGGRKFRLPAGRLTPRDLFLVV